MPGSVPRSRDVLIRRTDGPFRILLTVSDEVWEGKQAMKQHTMLKRGLSTTAGKAKGKKHCESPQLSVPRAFHSTY